MKPDPAWRAFARVQGLPPSWLEVLEAFAAGSDPDAGASAASPDSMEDLERRQAPRALALPLDILDSLACEVDRDQAAMFGRRFEAVASLLSRLSPAHPSARLLRSGLVHRLDGILATPGPRALRVRACIDFYYSHAARVLHEGRLADAGLRPSALAELVDSSPWVRVRPGLFHRRITGDGPEGPVHVNALRFDRGRYTFRVVDLAGRGAGGLDAAALEAGAVAAVSGGFFLYSESDIEPPCRRFDPVGLLLSDGMVLNPPVFRRGAFVQDVRGHCHVRTTGLAGVTVEGPAAIRIRDVNPRGRRLDAPAAFTRAGGASVVAHPGPSLVVHGRSVHAVVARGEGPIPLGGFVLCLPDRPEWRSLSDLFAAGTPIGYRLPDVPREAPLRDGMAGGPVLLREGRSALDLAAEELLPGVPPATLGGDETGDQSLLPRLAAGLTADHRVVFAAVDGRDAARALGMNLSGTGLLMQLLGCVDAVNLDGGASKRMLLEGRTLDLPTTEILAEEAPPRESPVRHVLTGILAIPGGEGSRS